MQKEVRIALGVAALVLVIAGAWRHGLSTSGHKDRSNKPVTVLAAKAVVRDTPLYLNSVATVQAYDTVLIRSRVDGEIVKVAFKEGANVRRGQILFELDRRPFKAQLRAARAQREKDIAQLDNANLDVARYETLVKENSLQKQTLDAARTLQAQLKAGIHADEAQIDLAMLQLDYATIRAPISGRAGALQVDFGNMVHASDTNALVTLTQIRPVKLQFSLPQDIASQLRQRQALGALPVDALSDNSGQVLDHGTLFLIDNQIDTLTRTILCKAIFRNDGEKLWPGAFVTARLRLADLRRAVVVPSTAIQPGASGPYVYVVTPEQTVSVQEVETGNTNGADTVILKGLKAGEIVVTEGQFQIEQGTKVDAHLQAIVTAAPD